MNNCSYTWTTQNGVNGGKFTGPNGGTIFLPAAGGYFTRGLYGVVGGWEGVGFGGCYWSSSSDAEFGMHGLSFSSRDAMMSGWDPFDHAELTVRPVR